MSVLLVGDSAPVVDWFRDALSIDCAVEVDWECIAEPSDAVARLRDKVYDVVLVSSLHDSPRALQLLDAIRAGSSDEQPILVLGTAAELDMADLCFESGADAYLCIRTTNARAMLWQLTRAVERHQLLLENRKHRNSQRHRLQLEHDEASRLLQQQRQLIAGLESIHTCSEIEAADSASPAVEVRISKKPATSTNQSSLASRDLPSSSPSALPSALPSSLRSSLPSSLPSSLASRYSDLLRTYVVMGSGNLGPQILQFAELLTDENLSSQQLMLMHLQVLEEVVGALGNRSARHVLNRADLLILEVMMHLAECYRVRSIRNPESPPETLAKESLEAESRGGSGHRAA